MNSRKRRKIEAKEHNERIALVSELKSIRNSIYKKHGVIVKVCIYDTNESIAAEINRLNAIFNSDTPPRCDSKSRSRDLARMQLAAIAAMAGIGGL